MAIGSVDFRPIMSKVNEVARIQNEQQQRVLGQEQQQAEASVRQAEQDTRSVHSQDQTNKVTITDKEEKRGGGSRKQNQNQESENNEEKKDRKEESSLTREGHIDIRL